MVAINKGAILRKERQLFRKALKKNASRKEPPCGDTVVVVFFDFIDTCRELYEIHVKLTYTHNKHEILSCKGKAVLFSIDRKHPRLFALFFFIQTTGDKEIHRHLLQNAQHNAFSQKKGSPLSD